MAQLNTTLPIVVRYYSPAVSSFTSDLSTSVSVTDICVHLLVALRDRRATTSAAARRLRMPPASHSPSDSSDLQGSRDPRASPSTATFYPEREHQTWRAALITMTRLTKIAEAAEVLDVSPSHLYSAIEEGSITQGVYKRRSPDRSRRGSSRSSGHCRDAAGGCPLEKQLKMMTTLLRRRVNG